MLNKPTLKDPSSLNLENEVDFQGGVQIDHVDKMFMQSLIQPQTLGISCQRKHLSGNFYLSY